MCGGKNRGGKPRLEYDKQIKVDLDCHNYAEIKRLSQVRLAYRAASKQLVYQLQKQQNTTNVFSRIVMEISYA